MTESILAALDLNRKLRMKVNTSDYMIEEVLLMKCSNGKWRPVVYLSKFLNKTERNYEIHDKEILAVIRGLENCRHLLKGTKFKFEVWTDHQNLKYFIKAQKLNRQQICWTLYLSRFNFTLNYMPEIKIGEDRQIKQKIRLEDQGRE